jgi:Sec-independent protein translocase protein TatA
LQSLAKIIGKFKEELNEEHQRKMDALKNEFDNRLTIQHEEYQKEMAQLEVF